LLIEIGTIEGNKTAFSKPGIIDIDRERERERERDSLLKAYRGGVKYKSNLRTNVSFTQR
jgi:hypothetical protein